jgi:hypothetical protein
MSSFLAAIRAAPAHPARLGSLPSRQNRSTAGLAKLRMAIP